MVDTVTPQSAAREPGRRPPGAGPASLRGHGCGR